MTELFAKAFEEASKLPDEARDQLAAQLLRDLEAEAPWGRTLASSPEALEKLAAEAVEEYRGEGTFHLGGKAGRYRLFEGM